MPKTPYDPSLDPDPFGESEGMFFPWPRYPHGTSHWSPELAEFMRIEGVQSPADLDEDFFQ